MGLEELIQKHDVRGYVCPDVFPSDLSAGNPVVLNNSSVKVHYDRSMNTVVIPNVPPGGKMQLVLCENGFRLSAFGISLFDMHYTQLARVEETTTCLAPRFAKAMIGRAIAGGMFFGEIGAAVGALSAMNKTKTMYDNVLIIYYWNVSTRELENLVLSSEKDPVPFLECSRGYAVKNGW